MPVKTGPNWNTSNKKKLHAKHNKKFLTTWYEITVISTSTWGHFFPLPKNLDALDTFQIWEPLIYPWSHFYPWSWRFFLLSTTPHLSNSPQEFLCSSRALDYGLSLCPERFLGQPIPKPQHIASSTDCSFHPSGGEWPSWILHLPFSHSCDSRGAIRRCSVPSLPEQGVITTFSLRSTGFWKTQ